MGFLAWFSIQGLNCSDHGSCHRNGLISFIAVKQLGWRRGVDRIARCDAHAAKGLQGQGLQGSGVEASYLEALKQISEHMGMGGLQSKFKQGAFESLFCGLGREIAGLGQKTVAASELSQI
jgi:hypothetical protein